MERFSVYFVSGNHQHHHRVPLTPWGVKIFETDTICCQSFHFTPRFILRFGFFFNCAPPSCFWSSAVALWVSIQSLLRMFSQAFKKAAAFLRRDSTSAFAHSGNDAVKVGERVESFNGYCFYAKLSSFCCF